MFRLSLFTTLLVLFMALAGIAAPVALQSPDRSPMGLVAPAIEARDESHVLEKRRSGKVSRS